MIKNFILILIILFSISVIIIILEKLINEHFVDYKIKDDMIQNKKKIIISNNSSVLVGKPTSKKSFSSRNKFVELAMTYTSGSDEYILFVGKNGLHKFHKKTDSLITIVVHPSKKIALKSNYGKYLNIGFDTDDTIKWNSDEIEDSNLFEYNFTPDNKGIKLKQILTYGLTTFLNIYDTKLTLIHKFDTSVVDTSVVDTSVVDTSGTPFYFTYLDINELKHSLGLKTDSNQVFIPGVVTNNTVFVKDKININGQDLDINKLRTIKNLPYNFKEKICIQGACINKTNIKMLKGKVPFKIASFTSIYPFRFFTDPNFGGWSNNFNTSDRRNKNVTMAGNGIKSFKITDDTYKFTAYEKINREGARHEFTADSSNVTSIFPNGFKSIQARTVADSTINTMCLHNKKIIHAPNNDTLIQPVPCEIASDVYYINRDDLLNHAHGISDIHFHDHGLDETYHPEENYDDLIKLK